MTEEKSQVKEQENKITSEQPVHIKNPKRVEQRKRLAAISKAAKERKALERQEAEKIDESEETVETPNTKNNISFYLLLFIVAGGLVYAGYSNKNKIKTKWNSYFPQKEKKIQECEEPKKVKSKLLSLD